MRFISSSLILPGMLGNKSIEIRDAKILNFILAMEIYRNPINKELNISTMKIALSLRIFVHIYVNNEKICDEFFH